MTTKDEAIEALRFLTNAIVEAVEEVGPSGSPAGPMFMALQHIGISLDAFEAITGALVRAGKIAKRGHVFYPVTHH